LEEDSDYNDDLYEPESSSSESDESDLDDTSDEEESVLSSMGEESDSDSDVDAGLALVLDETASVETDGTMDSPAVEDRNGSAQIIKLCGENLDKTVKTRYMRLDKGNLSLHYFHAYAVLDRIDLSGVSDSLVASCLPSPEKIATSLLPSKLDDQTLKHHFAILVSRVLATHIKFFSFGFDDVVQWHIQHVFSKQMAEKSVVVRISTGYITTLINCS
jgi:L1 cell adhesion molecule like protein